MQDKIKIFITTQQYDDLMSYSTDTDLAKGKVIEYIVKELLLNIDTVKEVREITDTQKQLHFGDLLVIDDKGILTTVEVKSSHKYPNTENGIDKLGIDYKYFEGYDRKEKKIIWYEQGNTGSDLGWIVDNKAKYLVAFNTMSRKAYIIKNFRIVADNILADIGNYIEGLEEGLITWYKNGNRNYINKYLEGSIKQDGDLKKCFLVNLTLSKEAINHYGGELEIIDIDLHLDLSLYEFRVLNGEIKSNLPRRRRERKAIIEEEDKKTTPSTVGSCKRRSRF